MDAHVEYDGSALELKVNRKKMEKMTTVYATQCVVIFFTVFLRVLDTDEGCGCTC